MKTHFRGIPLLSRTAALWACSLILQQHLIVHAAEPSAPAQPPRIGLALSGGGARGIAHLGVLKVLKELRVPVHCVTGTSMGSIFAGVYASGLTVEEMEARVRGADWDDVFRDYPPREDVANIRKLDDYKTLFAPEYGVKDGQLAFPKGVVAGVTIEAFFRQLTDRAVSVSDFRNLPIPFRAVAADIATGEAVVIDHGSVSRAMRASMAIPGAMTPVEFEGRLLVDGAIANNLPIDEARKLCGDVIIAVDISTPPLRREEIRSAVTVTAQLYNLLGKITVEEQLKRLTDRDVLITPDLGDIGTGDFKRGDDAIRLGEEAARKMADSLRRYSLPPEQYAALRHKQTHALERTALGTVDEIRFEGLKRTAPGPLRPLVESKPGEPLTEEKISADLRRIYGRGDYESVDYRIQQEPGSRVLVIEPREKEWGPNYLRFGLGLATDFQGDSAFNILAQYRRTWLNRLGGEWLTEIQLGSDSQFFTQFIQPVEETARYYVAPHFQARSTSRGVFIGEDRVAEYDVKDVTFGLDAGANFGTWGYARLGPLWRRIDASVDTGSPVLPELTETTAGPRALFVVDQLDRAWFPRAGYRGIASAYFADSGFGSDRNYKRFEGQFTTAKSWGAHTFNVGVLGGTDAGSDMPPYDTFTLGGPLRLSGYRINEFAGRRMAFGRVMYYNRTIPLPTVLGAGIYAGASLEVGEVRNRFVGLPSSGTTWSGSVFIAADTFAGPAYFGFGKGEGDRWSLYLLLGAP
jgi:NTE family protein